jgi:pyruvate ferredoxin oxidoreductase alpha subunit
MAYRLAEDKRVRLPVVVNMDGFYLSFTREPVQIPETKIVSQFVGEFDPVSIRFRASAPVSQAVAVLGGTPYSYFRYETHLAALNGLAVYDEIVEEFANTFGRRHEAVEGYRSEDAELVFVMMGSFATKAKDAVDQLREAGWRIGLLRPRLLRPFPAPYFHRALKGKRGVAVIDQNLSMGMGGVLYTELASALYGQASASPVLVSFIGGLGGRDIGIEEFYEMAAVTRKAVEDSEVPPPRLLYTKGELREVKKLQEVAHAERQELGKE